MEKRTRRGEPDWFRAPPSREPAVWGAPRSLWSDAQITRKLRELTQDHRREEKQLCTADFRLCTHHDQDPDATAVTATLETHTASPAAARGLNSRRQVEPSPALPATPDWSAPLLCTFRLVEGAAAPEYSPSPGAVPPTIPCEADWVLSSPIRPWLG